MAFETKEYVRQLTIELAENMREPEDKHTIVIIKHYNSLSISESDAKELSEEIKEFEIIYHFFNTKDVIGVYEPFLNIIRKKTIENNVDIDELMDICNVYSMHRNVIREYINGEQINRIEEYIFNEVDFEECRMRESIANMLEYFADKTPIIFIINKLQRASLSTIKLIKELDKRNSGKIGIVASVNDFVEIPIYMKQEWNDFIYEVSLRDNIKEWGFNTITTEEQRSKEFRFMTGNIMNYIYQLELMFYMVSLREAEQFATVIYENIIIAPDEISATNKLRFYEMYAMIEIYVGNTAKVINACEKYDKTAQTFPSAAKTFTYYFLLTINQINKGKSSESDEYLSRCIDAANETKNEFLMFKASLLKHMTRFSGWKNLWLYEQRNSMDLSLLEKAKKYNYLNHLAHIYIYAMDTKSEFLSVLDNIEEKIPNFNKGIEIAKQLNNEYLIKNAYRRNILMSSACGFYDVTKYFIVEKLKPIVEKTNDKFEVACIYNDLGYNACTMENYHEANEYFHKALECFIEIKQIDYTAETLYNMSVNCLMSYKYEETIFLLDKVISIINIYKSESIRVAHITKIYGILSYCNGKLGKVYESCSYLNLMEVYLKKIIAIETSDKLLPFWEDDLFLYHIGKAIQYAGERKYILAEKEFEKAYIFGGPSRGSAALFYGMYAKEVYDYLNSIGREMDAKEEIAKCLEYYKNNGYSIHAREIEKIIGKCNSDCDTENQNFEIDFAIMKKDLEPFVYKKVSEYSFEKNSKCIQYLQVWQKLMKQTYLSSEHMIYKVMLSILSEFKIDKILFVTNDKERYRIRYNNLGYAFDQKSIDYIGNYFYEHKKVFVASKMNKNFFEFEKIANTFADDHLCSIAGIPIFEKDKVKAFTYLYIRMSDNWVNVTRSVIIEKYQADFIEYILSDLLNMIEKFELKEENDRLNVTV